MVLTTVSEPVADEPSLVSIQTGGRSSALAIRRGPQVGSDLIIEPLKVRAPVTVAGAHRYGPPRHQHGEKETP